ncbi:MAG: hypothetical protein RL473_174 [Actinomycetota bacterium]
MIIGGVVLAIVIAFVIAIVAGGSKDSGSSDTTKAPSSDGSVSAGENQPVEVVGEALEALPESGGDSTIGVNCTNLEWLCL